MLENESDAEYCSELAMKFDRERMFCALTAPVQARPALMALLAWNYEVAKVAEVVSDPMVGLIRLQWWRDALDEIYDGKPVREHAVATELARAIHQFDLPRERFDAILSTREADLEPAPFDKLQALDLYAADTAGTLAELWLDILGNTHPDTFSSARHVGSAWALVGILRGMHFQLHRGRMLLPGIDAQTLLQTGFDEKVGSAVETVCHIAEEHIAFARSACVPKHLLSAFLPAVLAEDYLKRIRKAKYDPFSPKVEAGRASRAMKLSMAKLRGRF